MIVTADKKRMIERLRQPPAFSESCLVSSVTFLIASEHTTTINRIRIKKDKSHMFHFDVFY